MKRWLYFSIVVLLPVADVGTLFLLSSWIGIAWTLAIVAVSTATGLLACKRWLNRLNEHNKEIKTQFNILVPPDVVLIQASEAFLSLFAMGCFLFPGLLSDLVGFFLALPRTQKGFINKIMARIRTEAEKEGKTIEKYLQGKAQKRP